MKGRLARLFRVDNARNRNLLVNTALSLSIKGMAVVVSMLTLPAFLRYFDDRAALGVWLTLVAVLGWILTFDLGVGNGLRNHLVAPIANGDNDEAKRLISSAYVTVWALACVVSVIGWFVLPLVDLNRVFSVPQSRVDPATMLYVVRVLFVAVMAQLLLRLIISVFYALQKAAVPSLLTLISSALLLVYITRANAHGSVADLRSLALAYAVLINIPPLLASLLIFSTTLRAAAPDPRYFRKDHALRIVKLGGVFLWLQLMTLLVFNTNEFLISWFVAPDAVVEYSVYNKVFGLIATLFGLALTPVWSAVTEACARNDRRWVLKLYQRLAILAFAVGLVELCVPLIFQRIVNLWLGDRAIHVQVSYAIVCAICGVSYVWATLNASLAAGIGRLKLTTILLTFGALANIPVAYLLVGVTHSWIAIVAANAISMIPYALLQPVAIIRYLKAETILPADQGAT